VSAFIPYTHAGYVARQPRRKHKAPKCDNALRRIGRAMARLDRPQWMDQERMAALYPVSNGRGDRLNAAKYPQRLARRLARQRRREGRVS
jgi:hypothetical protein